MLLAARSSICARLHATASLWRTRSIRAMCRSVWMSRVRCQLKPKTTISSSIAPIEPTPRQLRTVANSAMLTVLLLSLSAF